MSIPNPGIFRAYDIRGVVDRDLSEDVYLTLGRAAGTHFHHKHAQQIVVGRDARPVSYTHLDVYKRQGQRPMRRPYGVIHYGTSSAMPTSSRQ